MIKALAKKLIYNWKNFWQKRLFRFPPKTTFQVNPKPSYVDQFAGAKKDKIEKSYGKINDQAAAKKFGAKNIDQFSFWAWRSCGIACLKMILDTFGRKHSLMTLINQALEENGYLFKRDLGWRHRTLISLAKKYGLSGKIIKSATIYDIALAIKHNRYVIASLTSPTGGHLCLFFQFTTNQEGEIDYFRYYNPSNYFRPSKRGNNSIINKQELLAHFQRKAIVIWKKE